MSPARLFCIPAGRWHLAGTHLPVNIVRGPCEDRSQCFVTEAQQSTTDSKAEHLRTHLPLAWSHKGRWVTDIASWGRTHALSMLTMGRPRDSHASRSEYSRARALHRVAAHTRRPAAPPATRRILPDNSAYPARKQSIVPCARQYCPPPRRLSGLARASARRLAPSRASRMLLRAIPQGKRSLLVNPWPPP